MSNILILARHLDLVEGGGSSRSLHTILTQLSDNEWNVEAHVTDNLNINTDTNYTAIDLTDKFSDKYPIFATEIKNYLLNSAPSFDLIHIFNPAFASISGYVRNKINTPIICRLNTYTPFCTNNAVMNGKCHQKCGPIDRFQHSQRSSLNNLGRLPRYISQSTVEKRYMNNIDQYFAISPAVKKVYKEYGIDTDIVVIPNFINGEISFKRQKKNNEIGSESENYNLLYVGRLVQQKGINILLQSIDKLNRDDVHVHLVGDGSERKKLEKFARKEHIDDVVSFHGWVPHDQLSEYYESCDLFVHPHTWPEPFGRVIIEALQHDCPIVTSNIGAPPWIAGEAGITFNPRNSEELSDKINLVLNNSGEIERMKSICPSRVEKFNPDKIFPQIEYYYEKNILN